MARKLRKASKALKSRLESAKTKDWRKKHFKHQNGLCYYCQKPIVLIPENARNIATLDHIIPLSKGGVHHWENTVASCGPCNREKDDLTADEFIAVIEARRTDA